MDFNWIKSVFFCVWFGWGLGLEEGVVEGGHLGVERVVAEVVVVVILRLGADFVAEFGIFDELLDGVGELELVFGGNQQGIFTVGEVFELRTVVGGDVRLAEHHIFKVAQSQRLGFCAWQNTEIALFHKRLHIWAVAHERHIFQQLISHNESLNLCHKLVVPFAHEHQVIGVAVELRQRLNQRVNALLAAQSAVVHYERTVGRNVEFLAQRWGRGGCVVGSEHAVADNHRLRCVEILDAWNERIVSLCEANTMRSSSR